MRLACLAEVNEERNAQYSIIPRRPPPQRVVTPFEQVTVGRESMRQHFTCFTEAIRVVYSQCLVNWRLQSQFRPVVNRARPRVLAFLY